MSKYVLFTLLLCAATTFSYAQETIPSIEWSQVEAPTSTSSKEYRQIVSIGKEAIFSYLLDHHTLYLNKLDLNMKLIKSVKMNLKYKDYFRTLDTLFVSGGKLCLLTTFFDNKQSKTLLLQEIIDIESLTLLSEPTEIASTTRASKLIKNPFLFKFSPDKQQLLVFSRDQTRGRKGVLNFKASVFDADMQVLWTHQSASILKEKKKVYQFHDLSLTNEGKVLVSILETLITEDEIGRIYDVTEPIAMQYFVFQNQGRESIQYKFWFGDIKSRSYQCKSRMLDDGRVLFAGYYWDLKDEYAGFAGTFVTLLDIEKQTVVHQSMEPLADEYFFSNKITDNPEGLFYPKGYFDASLNHLIIEADGSLLLISECLFVAEVHVPNASGFSYLEEIPVFGDILAVKMNLNGEKLWETRLPKVNSTYPYSKSTIRKTGNYALVHQDGNYYFIFNTPASIGKLPVYYVNYLKKQKFLVQAIQLNQVGEWKESTLYQTHEGRPNWFLPESVHSFPEGTSWLFMAMNADKFRYGHLSW